MSLVERLRLIAAWNTPGGKTPDEPMPDKMATCNEAADELERVYAERDALREDAERYRWMLRWLERHGLLSAVFCQPDAGMKAEDWWLLRRPAVINGGMPDGYGKTEDAAIDAARGK